MTLDGNSLYTRLDPRTGGRIAVAEACRNLACVGARPIGVTNCLNFGNPEKPEVMWQFEQAVDGLAEACRAFGIPVTGGNVSFYNDTEGAVHPPDARPGRSSASSRTSARPSGPGFQAAGRRRRPPRGEPATSWAGRSTSRSSTASRPGRRRRSTSNGRSASRNSCSTPSRPGSSARPTTCPRAGWPWPWPSAPSTAARKIGLRGRPRPTPSGPTPCSSAKPSPASSSRAGRPDLGRLLEMAAAQRRPGRGHRPHGRAATRRHGSAGREILRAPRRKAFRAWKDGLPDFFKVRA